MLAGTLEIQMLANIARLSDDMRTAQSTVSGAMKNIESAVSSAKAALGALGVGLSIGYFVDLVKGSIDAMDHLNDLSKTTGIAVESLAGLKLAAKQSGSDLDSIAQSVSKLAQNMGKDDVAGKFKALGITAKDPLEAFKQLSDVFVSIQDPQLRAAVAAQALGKQWAGAAPLLAEGSAKITEMVERGAKLSGVTQEMAEQADKFNDALAELKTTSDATVTRLVGPMLGGFTNIVKAVQLAYEESGKLTAAWVALGGLGSFLFTDDFLSRTVKENRQLAALNSELAELIKHRNEMAAPGFAGAITNFLPDLDVKIREVMVQMKLIQAAQAARVKAAQDAAQAEADAKAKAAKAAEEAAARAREFLALNKEMNDKYIALTKTIQEQTGVESAELEGRVKLTDAQKIAMKAMVDLRDGNIVLTDIQKKQLATQLSTLLAIDKEIELRKQTAEVYKAAAAAADEQVKAEERRNDVLAASAVANSQALQDIKFETEMIKNESVLNAAGLLQTQDQIRLTSQVNLAREISNGLRQIDLQLQRDLLATADEASDDNNRTIDQLYEMAAAQKAALPDVLAAREAARLTNDLARSQADDFKQMWSTVESTGHNVWTIMTAGGQDMAHSVGTAIKASIVDLLYQLTIKKWIINIGTSIQSSLAGSAGSGGIGDLLGIGSSVNSLAGGGNVFSSVGSLFGAGGSGAAYGITTNAALDAASMSSVDALAGLNGGGAFASGAAAGGIGSAIGTALPYVGAALLAYSLLAGDGGGPKPSEAWLQGGPGSYNIGIDNASDGTNMALVRSLNALLADPTKYDQTMLQQYVGKRFGNGSPTDTGSLISMLTQALAPAADAAAATARLKQAIDGMRESLLAAQDPIGYWSKQVASLQGTLGTSAATVEQWRTDFLAALDATPTQDQFNAWSSLGDALQKLADAGGMVAATLAPITAAFQSTAFATLVDYTRYQQLLANGIDANKMAIPHFATGGIPPAGLSWVGESGPELIATSGSSRVFSHSESARFFDVSALIDELRALRSEAQAGQVAIARNTGQVAKFAFKWDRDGLGVRGVDPTLPLEVNVVESVPVPVS